MGLIGRARNIAPRQRPAATADMRGAYLVTTADRRGAHVTERVSCQAVGGRLYACLPGEAELAGLVWDTATVAVCPCDLRGRPVSAPQPAVARILSLEEEGRLERVLGPGRLAPRSEDLIYLEISPARPVASATG